MPLLQEKDAAQVRSHFSSHMKGPVTIDYFTQHDSPLIIPGQECLYCRETRMILEELAGLSSQIQLNVHDFVSEAETAAAMGISRIPGFTIRGAARGQVRYFGIPAGYEFAGLIEDIVDVSAGTTNLSAKTKTALAGLTKPVHIQVYVTPT